MKTTKEICAECVLKSDKHKLIRLVAFSFTISNNTILLTYDRENRKNKKKYKREYKNCYSEDCPYYFEHLVLNQKGVHDVSE